MKLVFTILILITFLTPIKSWSDECGFADGGYCVDKILEGALQGIGDSNEVQENSLADGTGLYVRYEKFWQDLVQKGLVTEDENKKAFEEAAKAGGTKIGGVNLVVLAARTLQKLVDLKLLTLEQAQEILNGARLRQP